MLYNSSDEKSKLEQKQIESLTKNVEYTKDLFAMGNSTYLEVISAQQSLLNAELAKVQDDFYKMQAVVIFIARSAAAEIKFLKSLPALCRC